MVAATKLKAAFWFVISEANQIMSSSKSEKVIGRLAHKRFFSQGD